ncbi:hypothetical protein E3P99_01215 [Wallemia hederae]|uniref:Uncharacterized protein n=1 Tax=Wallemia hederae TaxID=1540922 RepID=A0A4T0FQP0_9BASI|nr:hypothetical protein E3P99_01215 [Wallemia hederae]
MAHTHATHIPIYTSSFLTSMMVGITELNPSAVGDVREWTIPDGSGSGDVSESLIKKMDSFKALKERNVHFNDRLQSSDQFHNPHITHRLIDWAGIDEYGTNIDSAGYKEYTRDACSAEAISSLQNARANDKAASSSKRRNIPFTAATNASSTNSNSKSRKH